MFGSRGLLLLFFKLAGVLSPAFRSKSHWLRYSAATSKSSISTELLACVHNPVFVQFWLPVHTQRGLFCLSQMTRNLLCPNARGEIIRSCKSIFPFSSSRASLFWSPPFFFTLPLASTTWARFPNLANNALSCSS